MSDETGTTATTRTPTPEGPRPEPLRFYGTTWVSHDGGYGWRRAATATGSLVAAVAGCLVLRFAYQGVEMADTGDFVNVLLVVMFAVCSAIAFRRTWVGFGKRHDPGTQQSLRSMMAIGFVGGLLAYFLRTFTEAPGEKLHRREYTEARAQYERRRETRTGNSATRGGGKKRKRKG
ncbi:hypothetical protein [Streptomyces tsukubensis]|uniref:EamA/RhaT family transporter n=1 Tax=Streptomyces tsukubensis TaxID=83656 RepID=A0A1V4A040_9ACTN|nr:hypothetical protein [Streptomyces tsukubensis]OON71641.1 hypothetical protein B1H18_32890 [Streptomyces tsukubensis]QFR95090.1 EamA/RhaT family transporter [Streptomyces tsukubensis]